jgi:hypothetical protein
MFYMPQTNAEPQLTRPQLRRVLQSELERLEGVLAMWEAGSHAFDRADDHSDLDIGLLVRAGTLPQAWEAIDRALDSIGGFELRWEPAAHLFQGMTQRVYQPRRTNRWLQIDVGIFEESAASLYLETQRHGRAEVVFDRTGGRTKPPVWDEDKQRREMREALHQEIMKWNAYYAYFRKELARGRTIDAFGFYVGLSLRPLLAVLGMVHRPDRWDYGFRYVKDEMPHDIFKQLEHICYIPDPSKLNERFAAAAQMFEEAVAELRRRGVMPIDAKGVDVVPNAPPQ